MIGGVGDAIYMVSLRLYLARFLRLTLITLLALPLIGASLWFLFLRLYGPPVAQALAREAVVDRVLPDGTILDDAGRSCPREAVSFIELRVLSDGKDYIGHAFLHWPRATIGFCTDEENIGLIDYLLPWSGTSPGYLRDDTEQCFDYVRRYCACPSTIEQLEIAVIAHADDPYQVGNWRGGMNCATWATHRLRDAGLSPPEGDCPNRLARQMTPWVSEIKNGH